VPRGYQVAWSSHLWSAYDSPLDLMSEGDSPNSMKIFPSGDRFATIGSHGVVIVGDAVHGSRLHILEHESDVEDVLVFPAGDKVVTRTSARGAFVWDTSSGLPLLNLSGHNISVADVAIFPSGRAMATGGYDGRVLIWDAVSGRLRLEVVAAPLQPRLRTSQQMRVQVFPDGERFVTYGSSLGAQIWNASSGDLIVQLRVGSAMSRRASFCAVSAKGDFVATWGRPGLQIWNATTGDLVRSRSAYLMGGPERARGLQFFPKDDRLLVFGAVEALIWDLPTGHFTFIGDVELEGARPTSVQSASISEDGRLLVTCNGRRASVWEFSTGRRLRVLRGAEGHRIRSGSCSVDIGRDLRRLPDWSDEVELWASV